MADQKFSLTEEHELARRMKSGDRQARTRLIEANMPYATSLAKKYAENGEFDELRAAAYAALVQAVDRWKPQSDVRFLTYAHQPMLHAIFKVLRKKSIPSTPWNHVLHIRELEEAEAKLDTVLGRAPTVDEIAEAMKIRPQTVVAYRERAAALLSPRRLDEAASDGEGSTLADVIPDEQDSIYEKTVSKQLKEAVQKAVSSLKPSVARVVELRYGLKNREHTIAEIGTVLSISNSSVRERLAVAEERLRPILKEWK